MLFRKVVELDEVPSTAPARIWIDGRYVLVVNGTELAHGDRCARTRSSSASTRSCSARWTCVPSMLTSTISSTASHRPRRPSTVEIDSPVPVIRGT